MLTPTTIPASSFHVGESRRNLSKQKDKEGQLPNNQHKHKS